MVKKRKISNPIGSLIPGSLLLIGLAFILFGLLDGPSITGMIVSDGSYISPTSDSGYLSPTSDGGYKSPTSDGSYVSPTSDTSYKSPTSDGTYKSPTSDNDYKTTISDDGYKSAKSDSNYTSPQNDDSYKSVTSGPGFNSSEIGAGFSGIITGPGFEKFLSDENFKIPAEDKSFKKPVSDSTYSSPQSDGSYKIPDTWSPYDRPSVEPRFNISTGPGFISVKIGYDYNATTIGEGLLKTIIDTMKELDNSAQFTVIDEYAQNSSVIVLNISSKKDQNQPSKDSSKVDAIKQAVNDSRSGFYLLSIEFFGSGNVFGYVQGKDGKIEKDIFSLDNKDIKLVVEAGKTVVLRPAPAVSKDLYAKSTHYFVEYRGDCLGKPEVCVLRDSAGNCLRAETRCTFVMDSDKNIQMLYTPKQPPKEYELEVIVKGGSFSKIVSTPEKIACGSGNTCRQNFSANKFVSLIAVAGKNEEFSGWSGWCSGTNSTCMFNMEKYLQVVANFEKKGIVNAAISWIGNLFTKESTENKAKTQKSAYRTQTIVSHEATQNYPSACDDYPTMPGCPGEGTNIVPPPSAPIPEVTFFSVEPKKAYPHSVVYIKGKNLGYVSKVYFNGELVEGFSTTPDGTELQTIVPQNAKTGEIGLVLISGAAEYSTQDFVVWTGVCSNPDVTIAFKQLNKRPQGQKDEDDCDVKKYGAYSNYKQLRNAIQNVVGFSKLSPATINSFRPSPTLPGSDVSIYGPSLDIKADDVKFDGTSIPFRLIDENEIKIKIPQDAAFGEHEVTIVSDIHGSGKAKLKIVLLPGIHSFSPNKVFTNEEITINGENLYEPEEISFFETNTKKEILTKNFRKESLQQIKVNAPLESGSYVITMKAKNSFARTQTSLTVSPKALPPQITSIEPEDGRLGNNAIVYGNNLKGITGIYLNDNQISYTSDSSETQKTIYVRWGIDHGLLKIKTSSGDAEAQLLSNKNPVTKLVTGKEETCFGGVGKGCYGSEDGKEEWGWGSQKIIAPVGCSNEVNGKRNCWSVPGSIKHDNCCARYPSGKMCGGPGKDGKPAGEDNHNGKCVDEWHAAFWDVFWWHAFVVTFDVTKPTDLTPKPSTRYTLKDDDGNIIPSETAETLKFCAPAGHELREQSDEGFCCSEKAVNKKCTGARGVQTIAQKVDVPRTENGADLSKVPVPLAPGEQPQLPSGPSEFELEVEGAFSGSVKTVDGKITNCRNQNICKAAYPKNTKVTLIATPDMVDYENSGWFGDCANTPKTENCILTMDSNKKVILGFFKKKETKPPVEPPKNVTTKGKGRWWQRPICIAGRYCVRPVLG